MVSKDERSLVKKVLDKVTLFPHNIRYSGKRPSPHDYEMPGEGPD